MCLTLADSDRSEQYAQLTNLAVTHSLKPYHAMAIGLRGQWLLLQNDFRAGIPLLKRALKELNAQRHEILNIDFVCDLGAALIAMGEHQEARADRERDCCSAARREIRYMPALFRMKGLVLASRSVEEYFEA